MAGDLHFDGRVWLKAAMFRTRGSVTLKSALAAVCLLAMPLAGALPAWAQDAEQDLELRVEQLEGRLRQLTGQNEELQYRNRQLEEQLRQLQSGQGGPVQAAVPTAPRGQPTQTYPAQAYPPQPTYQQPQPAYPQAGPPQPASGGRRGDAFDPSANPTAPGAPRPLGSIVGQPSAPLAPDIGAPGGRGAGEPLDLANTNGPNEANAAPGPGQPYPQAAPQRPGRQTVATLPPTNSPKDEFDLGYGYIQRKDYALADETLRAFLQKYPSDRLVPEANYWLGESLFQRQRFRDAAESFLTITTKFETAPKAPDALLRLGQSLAALKEKEAACAAFGEVVRKYPNASGAVKTGVDREQKRIRC
jgi:tol-pal system protein YbgF